jgi:anti-sigma factor RsiW
MPRGEERVSVDSQQLSRFLDGEMTPDEAAAFQARLRESPSLKGELEELQRVGAAIRLWSRGAEERAKDLLEPTLERARLEQQRRSRHGRLGYVAAALSLVTLPWAGVSSELAPSGAPALLPAGAAIERVELRDQHAQVFIVGSASTPVLWLADDGAEDDVIEQDPG